MPEMQKRPTMPQTQTNEFNHARLILSQWSGHKRGGGGAPPRGVTIRRPTVGVRSVLDRENYLNAKSQSSYLEVLAPDASDPSLFLSPGAWGTPESSAKIW